MFILKIIYLKPETSRLFNLPEDSVESAKADPDASISDALTGS